jgi:transcriptional regulator with XRE-family HTH domain
MMRTETGKANAKRTPRATKNVDGRKKNKGAASNGIRPSRPRKARGEGRKPALPKAPPKTLRTDFGLDLATFAGMAGVSPTALAAWEQGKTVRLDDQARGRLGRVTRILEGLARVMQRRFIPTWLRQPNAACEEAGARTPLDLFERADYETLEDMVWYLESGTPS